MEWQTIDTAPKMKTVLLFAVTDRDDNGKVLNWKMGTGSWHTGYEEYPYRSPWCWEGRQLASYDVLPTHWMPLPPPPSDGP